ncbi:MULTISPECIES: protocatechuate 3,4-dioxygenase subunit beta [unclassified Microbacterium]|uniref:protocatechuate 3,4-dioxygenase subunit beta n=1 Tax=unclassified Microbacterium TaxID=2609290 RepID=UPI00214CBC75|nr:MULTISPECIES: protocatechuate 3,4-dioxygenase subunit beta [unclassified Microbacterium]MCR2783302.1 protocatechuate 3,4-dioxygenase subunit beta [Microbacterium sp. zg.B96]MDL5351914.1 protocatechuate 3,4-dioxygenase subunit beta [Microbacterium sp. zg-YB36]WIM15823.1 protocatechuate 3,4-dioxygenase subunit beta [Microbacterium sp. zg-B96]
MTDTTAAAPETLLASPDQLSQAEITQEIRDRHAEYAAREASGERLPATMHDFPPYRSSILRHPTKNPKLVDPETIELVSPAFGQRDVAAIESDLTLQHAGEPLGERMTVRGTLRDSWGRPIRNQLIEIWQANSAGRYIHQRDQHPAPLDPNFTGAGRTITNDAGEYLFTTIKPGPYPWKNHVNAWRPAHIHFSIFGSSFTHRLVTQMYFPGDPLFALDPIYNTIWRQSDRDRLVGVYDHDLTSPEWSTGYRFDIVVDGSDATWFEPEEHDA